MLFTSDSSPQSYYDNEKKTNSFCHPTMNVIKMELKAA